MAATITGETLHELRVYLQQFAGERALGLLAKLDHVDTALDPAKLSEVANYAREQARGVFIDGIESPAEQRRVLAACSRIVELSTDVLAALAEAKLPAGALRVLGRECSLCDVEQSDEVAAICTSPGCPRRAEFDAGVRVRKPVNGCKVSWTNAKDRSILLEAEGYIAAAANDAPSMAREQVEALTSHDRVVLVRIFASLMGERLVTREEIDVAAAEVDAETVWSELEATREAMADALELDSPDWPTIIRIAAELGRDAPATSADELETWKAQAARAHAEMLLREGWLMTVGKNLGLGPKFSYQDVLDASLAAATAPRYSPPDSHPLRLYQWGRWLGALLEALRAEVDAGFRVDTGRGVWLEMAIERVEALDVAGLRGLVEAAHDRPDESPLDEAETVLLLFASGATSHRRKLYPVRCSGSWVSAGSIRVPRVRGETVEVGS